MTKTIKKSFVVVLMLVMSLFFALAVGTGYSSASAADEEKTDAQVFIENVETFKTTVGGEDGLSAEEIRNSMSQRDKVTLFFRMYNYVSSAGVITDADVKAAKQVYQKIYDQYNLNGAVDLYTSLTSSVYAIYTEKGQSYKDAFKVEAARTAWNDLNTDTAKAQDLGMLKNSDLAYDTATGDPDMLVKAEAKVKEWKKNIDDAIDAIKQIQVVTTDADTATVAVFDTAANKYLDTYVGVLKSQNTLTAAKNAIAVVETQGDLNFLKNDGGVNHYAVYNKVTEGYNAQNAKVKAVVDLIQVAYGKYSEEAGKEVCYSIHDDIVAARTAFDLLVNTPVNALQDKVKAYDDGVNYFNRLTMMEAKYADVVEAIAGVVAKINDIGEVKYTEASKGLIDAARAAFDALPADVKAHDTAEETETTWVENYQTLLDAEAKFAEYVAQVDNSIKAINGMKAFVNGSQFYSEYNKMFTVVNKDMKDLENQLNGNGSLKGVWMTNLDESYTPEDAVSELKTCKDAYDYYRNLATKISAQTQSISNNITAIRALDLRFTEEFENLYVAISNAINSLPKVTNSEGVEVPDERFIGAISGYAEWLTIKADYEALVAVAEEWLATVVSHTVTVNDFEALTASEEKYKALEAVYFGADEAEKKANLATDLAAFTARSFTLEEVKKTYQAWFELYKAGLDKRVEIIAATDALKAQIEALVRPELNMALDGTAGNAAYKTAVEAVTAAYNKLTTDFDVNLKAEDKTTQVYFQENYADAFAAYETALVNVKANAVEEKIALIETDKELTENRIAEARKAYDDAAATLAEGVEFAQYVRNYEALTTVEALVNGFVDDVNSLLKGAAYDGSDVAVADLVVETAYTNDKLVKGLYKADVSNVTALLAKYASMTAVQKAYVTEGKNVETAYAVLEKVARIAAKFETTVGAKLTYLDDVLDEFVGQYKAGSATTNTYETLNAFVEALTESQQALLHNLADFQQIQRDKEVADQLQNAIDKLDAEVSAGKITNETVIDYYVINTIYENLNNSQKALLGKNEAGEFTASLKLAEIKGKIDAAVESGAGVIDITAKFEELNTALNNAKTDLNGKIDTINASLEALNTAKAALEAKDTELNGLITALQTAKTELENKVKALEDRAAALEAKDTELGNKINDIVKEGGTLDTLKKALEDAYKAADKALEDAYKAADVELEKAYKAADEAIKTSLESTKTALEAAIKAETEAREAATQKLNKALVTVSVIFGILIAGLIACVVLLFVKKRA